MNDMTRSFLALSLYPMTVDGHPITNTGTAATDSSTRDWSVGVIEIALISASLNCIVTPPVHHHFDAFLRALLRRPAVAVMRTNVTNASCYSCTTVLRQTAVPAAIRLSGNDLRGTGCFNLPDLLRHYCNVNAVNRPSTRIATLTNIRDRRNSGWIGIDSTRDKTFIARQVCCGGYYPRH